MRSDNAYNHRRGTLIRIEGGDCFRGSGFAAPDQLEILTEEKAAEIERQQAEEAKWAKIGRKVGEYKNGDVVRYDYDRWDWREYYGDPAADANKTSIKWGGFIDGIAGFDFGRRRIRLFSHQQSEMNLVNPVDVWLGA